MKRFLLFAILGTLVWIVSVPIYEYFFSRYGVLGVERKHGVNYGIH